MNAARTFWQLYEPLHAVTYFAPQARDAFEDAGLRGFWRGYFAGRAAPLGAASAGAVTALFFSFAPGMVARAVPDVWNRASPERALAARLEGAVAALRAVLPPDPARWAEAADVLEAAAASAETAGRALGAANAALLPQPGLSESAAPQPLSREPGLPRPALPDSDSDSPESGVPQPSRPRLGPPRPASPPPGSSQPGLSQSVRPQSGPPQSTLSESAAARVAPAPERGPGNSGETGSGSRPGDDNLAGSDRVLARLWQAATVLREHRGDGHIAALVDAQLDGCQALALRDALHGGRALMQPARGWTDAEWTAATAALAERGWLDRNGRPTAAGRVAHESIEERTDRLAVAAGDPALIDLLRPLARAAGAILPYPNPIGVTSV